MKTAQEIYESSRTFSAEERKRLYDSISNGIAADVSLELMMLMADISCLSDAEKTKLTELFSTVPVIPCECTSAGGEKSKGTQSLPPEKLPPIEQHVTRLQPAEGVSQACQSELLLQTQSQLNCGGSSAGTIAALLMVLLLLLGGGGYFLYNMLNDDVHYTQEIILELQPKMGDYGEMVPPSELDKQQICETLTERMRSCDTSSGQIHISGNLIYIKLPQFDDNPAKNEEKLDFMERRLTKMAKLELLAVYPEQDSVLADPKVQDSIAQYEERLDQYNSLSEEEQKHTRKPALPRIPAELGLSDYQILPGPVTNDETGEPELDKHGKQKVYYYVLQKPYVAMQKDVYITGAEVSKAQPDHQRKGYVDVVLNRAGADRMERLTGSMQIGRDRMAVVLNSQVKCAPVVQAVLHKDFNISGLNGKGEPEDISEAFASPLPYTLKVVGRGNVSDTPPEAGQE